MARKSKFTEAEVLAFMKEVEKGLSVRELCRRHGFTEKTFYRWRARFSANLTPVRPEGESSGQLQDLEEENRRLRELVAELSLDNYSLRSTMRGRPVFAHAPRPTLLPRS